MYLKAEWTTARADCEARLGGDLLYFDTREEADHSRRSRLE